MIYYSIINDLNTTYNTYNDFISNMQNDDDFACFINSNSKFTSDIYDTQLKDITAFYHSVGIFTGMTNSPHHSYQHVDSADSNGDFSLHRDIGYKLSVNKRLYCEDVTHKTDCSLFYSSLVVIKKRIWNKYKYNVNKGLDAHLNKIIRNNSVYKIEGLYVYTYKDNKIFDNIKALNSRRLEDKKLLVIMAAYNAQSTIEMAIDSILNQTHKNIHLCIVDDCSTDSTLDIVKKKYRTNSNVTVYKLNKNAGSYVARNVALKELLSDFDYWALHDADDYAYAHRFAFLLSKLARADALAVNCGFNRIDYHTKELISTKTDSENSIVYNKLIFNRLGFYDETTRYGGDSEYRNRFYAAFNVKSLCKTNEILFDAYITGNNCTIINALDSPKRKKYMAKYKSDITQFAIDNSYYRNFTLSPNKYNKVF